MELITEDLLIHPDRIYIITANRDLHVDGDVPYEPEFGAARPARSDRAQPSPVKSSILIFVWEILFRSPGAYKVHKPFRVIVLHGSVLDGQVVFKGRWQGLTSRGPLSAARVQSFQRLHFTEPLRRLGSTLDRRRGFRRPTDSRENAESSSSFWCLRTSWPTLTISST